MEQLLQTSNQEFDQIISKIKQAGEKVDALKKTQFEELNLINNALEFKNRFARRNSQIMSAYSIFERETENALKNLDLNFDQGKYIFDFTQELFEKWDQQIEKLIKHVENFKKIIFVDFRPDILKALDDNRNQLKKSINDMETIWTKNGDKKIIKKVVDAFKTNQRVKNLVPRDKNGVLWHKDHSVTAEDLGIEVPKIREINEVTIDYKLILLI